MRKNFSVIVYYSVNSYDRQESVKERAE